MDWILKDLINDLKILKKKHQKGLDFSEKETNTILALAHQVREIKGEGVSSSDLVFRKALIASLPHIIWYITLLEET